MAMARSSSATAQFTLLLLALLSFRANAAAARTFAIDSTASSVLVRDTLTGTGTMRIKQSEFGIEPTAAAGGLVKVEDEVTVTLRLVGRAGGAN